MLLLIVVKENGVPCFTSKLLNLKISFLIEA